MASSDLSKVHFWNYILDSSGVPIENAEVRLYLNDYPTVEANIYTSETSSSYTQTSVADIKTDNDGFFEFWIPDQWDDGGYEHSQLFRLEWYKAGTIPGVMENINPWPNIFAWENDNTGADKNSKNKFVSDYLVNEWLTHTTEIVPSASPHDLHAVDYNSGCDSNVYNKVVSNKLLKDIITLSKASSAESLSNNNLIEHNQTVTSWVLSSGIYYSDIFHTGINVQEVLVEAIRYDNDKKYDLKRVVNLNNTTTRIFVENELDLRVNIQGISNSSSSSSSSSSKSSSSKSSSSKSSSSSSSVSVIPGELGIFADGYEIGGESNVIDYITINSTGNAIDFGDSLASLKRLTGTSNGTNDRGVFAGGSDSLDVDYNLIQYITINIPSNSFDFGDLTIPRLDLAGTSNGANERGVFGGGIDINPTTYNTMDYITINSTGNATDFGDLTVARYRLAGTSNGTNERGVFAGGTTGINSNVIDYITINSTGDATDFGDLTTGRSELAGTSNGTNERGVFGGGLDPTNVIYYITINSTGNATDFGDLTLVRWSLSATSNGTNERGVFAGGSNGSSADTIDYITINSIGDATDFGDLTVARFGLAAVSNA